MPTHRHRLACDNSAPRLARAWVTEHLRDLTAADTRWRATITADAALCVSELVTNSLIANATALSLCLAIEPDWFRLSVLDAGHIITDQLDPSLRAQQIGFNVIDAIADHWGIDPAPPGRELWAVFHAHPPNSPTLGPA